MIQLLAYLITVTIKFVPDHVLVTGCHVNAVEVRRPGRVVLASRIRSFRLQRRLIRSLCG